MHPVSSATFYRDADRFRKRCGGPHGLLRYHKRGEKRCLRGGKAAVDEYAVVALLLVLHVTESVELGDHVVACVRDE